MFTLAQSLNSKIFAKTMSDLEPRSENYHKFVETIFEKKINASCWFIARNGSSILLILLGLDNGHWGNVMSSNVVQGPDK